MAKLPEKTLEQIDVAISEFYLRVDGILKEHPEWATTLPRLIAGLMMVVCAGREDVMARISEVAEPLMAEVAETGRRDYIEDQLHKRRN